MKQAYTHILTFLFKHRYFRNHLFQPTDVACTESSTRLLTNLGIIIKPFAGGFNLLASDPELLDSINEGESIQLHLNCNDPLYINYTELPLYRPNDKLIYFNNLSAISDPGNERFLLHEKEFVGENEVVQLTQGKINVFQFDPAIVYRFADSLGNEISSECVTQSLQDSGEFMLSNLPPGLVRIYTGKQEVGKYYYSPKTIWKKPLGIVEIYTGKLFDHYKEKGKVEYAVVFNNRQTIWKYFLVSPVYHKFDKLSIINKGKDQIFNPPQKQAVLKNPEAWVFESKTQIPLSENSEENYQLIDNYDPIQRSGKVIHKNLTKASPEQLHYDLTKFEEPVYSHIYL
jgi:hypothetical protein